MIDIAALSKQLSDLGLIGGLIAILLGGVRGWWVFGWTYRAAVADRDTWRELALRGTELATKAIDVRIPPRTE